MQQELYIKKNSNNIQSHVLGRMHHLTMIQLCHAKKRFWFVIKKKRKRREKNVRLLKKKFHICKI